MKIFLVICSPPGSFSGSRHPPVSLSGGPLRPHGRYLHIPWHVSAYSCQYNVPPPSFHPFQATICMSGSTSFSSFDTCPSMSRSACGTPYSTLGNSQPEKPNKHSKKAMTALIDFKHFVFIVSIFKFAVQKYCFFAKYPNFTLGKNLGKVRNTATEHKKNPPLRYGRGGFSISEFYSEHLTKII